MPKSMVGLLAAAVATMPVLASLAHGYLFLAVLVVIAAAGYLVCYATAPKATVSHRSSSYAALSENKKNLSMRL